MAVRRDAAIGCLLGMAVGDALGLPAEGISRRRQLHLFPQYDRHHFLFGRGMVSDDTEHACLTAQSLVISGGEPERFVGDLSRRLRWWFAGLPAGIGRATARACVKLWLGYSPHHSGVYSAGNGPAMRSPIIGACFGDATERLRDLVRVSTRITHTDPKAEGGALAIALATHTAATVDPPAAMDVFFALVLEHVAANSPGLLQRLDGVRKSVVAGQSTADFAAEVGLGRGVSGYIEHTVPVAVHAWLSHHTDYRSAVLAAIRCGGDADTVAAVTGGIVGARVGKQGIPAEWLDGIWDWPRSIDWIERLGARLAELTTSGTAGTPLPLAVWAVPPRNLFFLGVVLFHGFRRLLPPY
jgi:ADP-ribosylglycohydrolase